MTQAIAVVGLDLLHDANDNGDMTGFGSGGSYFNPASGLEVLNPSGIGWAINPTGTAIVGGGPRLWNKVAGVWQATTLPTDPSSSGGRASSLSADGLTGQVLLVGGLETVSLPKHTTSQQPRLWKWQSATNSWDRVILPTGSTIKGDVLGVSDNAVAVGWIEGGNFQAAVWEFDGSRYSLTILAPGGSRAMGINRAGTIIVGASGGFAAYWQRLSGGGWSAPIALPGGCGIAQAVDDFARIVVNSCPEGNHTTPAVFVVPYSTTTMIRLGGQGPNLSAYVLGMSPSGKYVVGQLLSGSTSKGAYWKVF